MTDPVNTGQGVTEARTVAWLIERKGDNEHPGPLWYAESAGGWHEWVSVASDAKRFSTKAEAEAFPAYRMIAANPDISVTEHVFLAARAPLASVEGAARRVRHKKRGTEYEVLGVGKMQTEKWLGDDLCPADMERVVVYRSLDDGALWVRPPHEFEDGRFEELQPLAQSGRSSAEPVAHKCNCRDADADHNCMCKVEEK